MFKPLGRPHGVPPVVLAYTISYEAKWLPAPGGIDVRDVDRCAERFVTADNGRITGIRR
jgi:hypothetical protein